MRTIFFVLAVLFSTVLFGQDPIVFKMEFEDDTYTVTQNLDAKYWGVYVKNEGKHKWQYGLYNEQQKNKSFYLEQKADNTDNMRFEWNLDNKRNIRWGAVATANGEVKRVKISEVKNGEMKSFDAISILVEDLTNNNVESIYLYENENSIYLGYAVKVNEMASTNGQK